MYIKTTGTKFIKINTMKQNLYLIIIFLFSLNLLQAQEIKTYEPHPKYPLIFKAIIPVEINAPDWIHKMYSDNPNIFEIEKAYLAFYNSNDFVKSLHTQNYKHLMKSVNQNHWFDENGFITVKENQEIAQSQLRSPNSTKSVQLANWTPIGPLNTFDNGAINTVSEQVNIYSVAQSISNPLIMLCGTETGAVFKSTDKGENWSPIGDTVFNDGVVSVEIDPTNANIMFVGTSNKIYRSLNGGNTWTQVFNVSSLSIYEFAINPLNNQLVFAAGNKGLYKSVNGGTTWSQVFTDVCWDIKFKTNDPQTVFLLKKNPTLKLIEFYKSIDGGSTFSLKSNGWFIPTPTSSTEGARMGVTNADANRLYVVMLGNVDNQTTDVNFIGVYRSDNAGENWTLPYDQNNDGTPNNNPGGPYSASHWCFSCFQTSGGDYNQGFYNLAIDVSDTDPNKFLVGMLNLFKSENGGTTYSRWGGYDANDVTTEYYRHPDHQDILINGNDVFVATDGGIDLYDANLNIVRAINKGINGSDNWGFGQGWNEDVVTAGRYHNGNGVYHANYGNGKFISLGGGESPTGYVNLGNNYKVYHSDIDARKITNNISELNTSILNLALYPNEDYYTSKKSEIEYDPRYYNHMYMGKENKLWKSEDGGNSFNLIQAFGTSANSIVTGIEISRQNPNIIFVAQRDGSVAKLWRTQDGGITWAQVSLPTTQAAFYISLNENNTLFIAFDNFTNMVYKSANLGSSWINLTTTTIENQSISGIIAQMGTNDGVYITMSGSNSIYYRNATHTDWQVYNHGLPINKRFMGILPFYKNGEIRVSGTRGFWKSPLFEVSLPVAQPMVASKTVDCHRTQVQFDDYSVLNHTGASWSWSFPGASTVSSTTVRNPLVTYTTPGFYNVTLTVTNNNGNSSTKTVTNIVDVLPSTCAIETASLQVLEMSSSTQSIFADNLNYGSTPNITFTGWIKPNGIQAAWAGIVCLGTDLVLGFSQNNELQFHPTYWASTGLYANANEWNFVSIRYTPTQVTIFLNDKKWTLNGSYSPVALNSIILGKHFNRNDRTYKGQMDEFTLWNRALSDNEIYLSRHLIKENSTDANLISYYQFNNTQNFGLVYDKKNANDLTISNSINFPLSTAPVGVGTSQLMTINATGTYNFSSANAALNFTGQVPNGKVVVSKLNVSPNEAPVTNPTGNEYWILNNYGTNISFNGLSSVGLLTSSNISSISPSNFAIYKRASNGHLQSGWLQSTTATSVSANTVNFSGANLNQSLQWYVGSSATLGIEQISPKTSLVVYPNPSIQGQQLKIEGIDNSFTITLFDVNAKIVLKKQVFNKVIDLDSSVSKGIYFYRIETDNKLYNGKLIIE
jgi:photosystem II stability/assembly factor-like uncharacterized protein